MARRFNTAQALEEVLRPGDSDLSNSSSSDDSSDVDWELPSHPPSCSSSEEDSSSTGEESGEPVGVEWVSKNGNIIWADNHTNTLRYLPAPRACSGPTTYACARISDLKSTFDLFLPDELLQIIVNFTNLEGRRTKEAWRDTNQGEIQAFLGLLILAGVYRSRGESTLSLWDAQTGRPIFHQTMARTRFESLAAKLRFDDRLTRPRRQREGKMAPIAALWEKWESRLARYFTPGENICIDEQLVAFRGRCSFRQYIPSKPAKYGLKVWVACDVRSSYAFRMQVYTGKAVGRPTPAETGQGKRVVLDLTEGLQGHTVTVDNFFTSYSLGKELLGRKLAMVGTIRRNKPELPPVLLKNRRRALRSSVFAFTATHTAVSYVPKRGKNVVLLSTAHREPAVSEEEHLKPKIILDYNACKGGVDHLDQCVNTYSVRRKTNRWPLILFFNILDVSAFNAFVLWMAVNPTWSQGKLFSRRLFLQELGQALVAPVQQIPPAVRAIATSCASSSTAAPHTTATATRSRCILCKPGKKRRATIQCGKCGGSICKEHTIYHCSSCATE